MKNGLQLDPDVIEFTAGADLLSGQGYKLGQLFGVIVKSVASGETAQLQVTGCVELPKTSANTYSVGALLYWDNSGAKLTTTSTSNLLIGAAIKAGANGETVGQVRLNGHARADG